MTQIFLAGLIAFVFTFFAIPTIIEIADKKKLFDIPDERKVHQHAIASLAGVGMFTAVIFAILLTVNFQLNPEFQYILAAMFLIFFTGLRDDLVELAAFKKLIVQVAAAGIIIHLGGIRFDNLSEMVGLQNIPSELSIPLSYIMIILVVNAFNLIDGVDGLSGSLGLMATLLLGAYFYLAGVQAYALLSFSLSAALLAFLIFNFHPAKIFMGDSGSLLMGLVLAILVIKFINTASNPLGTLPVASAAAIGISLVLIPLVDTIRVFAIRILKGRSPFSPDRNHVHHILLDKGLNHSSVNIVCVLANILIIAAVYAARGLNNIVLLLVTFAFSFMIVGTLFATISRRKLVEKRQIINVLNAKRANSKVIELDTNRYVQEKKH